MAGEDEKVSTYSEFREQVLPRIKAQGYNAIQLMAIQVGCCCVCVLGGCAAILGAVCCGSGGLCVGAGVCGSKKRV